MYCQSERMHFELFLSLIQMESSSDTDANESDANYFLVRVPGIVTWTEAYFRPKLVWILLLTFYLVRSRF